MPYYDRDVPRCIFCSMPHAATRHLLYCEQSHSLTDGNWEECPALSVVPSTFSFKNSSPARPSP